jgi:FkbM family methyltransferase
MALPAWNQLLGPLSAKIFLMMRRGPLNRVTGVAHELSVLRQFRLAYWPRLLADILLFRAMHFVRLPREDTARTVQMRDGTWLTYRLNRGDIQAIREVWLDEVYLPPPEATGLHQVVDLGANIGFTSLYLSRQLNAPHLIAVEPDPANVSILRRNLEQNDMRAIVIDAAAGDFDGWASVRRERASNLGQLDAGGDVSVRVVSMASVNDRLPDQAGRTLLKIDIEGGEEQLFTGDLSWLQRFDCLLAELHPGRANLDRITGVIEASGLRFRPAGRGGTTSCWVRAGASGAGGVDPTTGRNDPTPALGPWAPSMKQAIKRAVLPAPGPRRLPTGIGHGLRMRVDFQRQTRTYLGLYEIELNRHLRRILRPGVTAFDIGVQHGYDSLVIAKHTGARVAAFECDPTCITGMRENFALNPSVADLIEPVPAMVGTGEGYLGLDDWAYNGGFVPDFIKLDIDGGEVDALRSAERILSERHPPLIVEVHSLQLERECGEILIGHGYCPTIVSQRAVLPDWRPSQHNRWLVA